MPLLSTWLPSKSAKGFCVVENAKSSFSWWWLSNFVENEVKLGSTPATAAAACLLRAAAEFGSNFLASFVFRMVKSSVSLVGFAVVVAVLDSFSFLSFVFRSFRGGNGFPEYTADRHKITSVISARHLASCVNIRSINSTNPSPYILSSGIL